ncbi:metal ABC transporter substrate-binding protein [Intrasporangium calvum]|uniref:Metal ABC transporter substrate-binding protein n=1 Tax=Intrasporangium calvum TaxID=53358 RepID=A0ABT5GJN1_9MICO|nr:metal ABC transporter substrate-binding protein [Intrasporangium calvum]MDC5697891.1 metal ABC transporter substrate-binding protein [Intrasporangium calvum]
MNRRLATVAAATALTLTAAACSSSEAPGGSASGAAGGKTSVVTSFYPIQFATEQIAGDAIDVTVLTKPGAEPHDLEIGAQDLARLTDSALVIYSKGFQPAVDDAVEQVDGKHVLDVSGAAKLTLTAAEEQGHAGESEAAHEEHAGGTDPHFWLDPERYASVADAIAARLAELDPEQAATYQRNAAAFVDKLTALDEEFTSTLKSCSIKELVTSHAAFTYLADRYGFEQHGIAGVSPEAEPSAAGLAEITALVKQHGVTTIYQETLVEPHFAETVAGSSGAKVATLDPLEGITDASAGSDYFEVMRSNLDVLKEGQGCS